MRPFPPGPAPSSPQWSGTMPAAEATPKPSVHVALHFLGEKDTKILKLPRLRQHFTPNLKGISFFQERTMGSVLAKSHHSHFIPKVLKASMWAGKALPQQLKVKEILLYVLSQNFLLLKLRDLMPNSLKPSHKHRCVNVFGSLV